jgi:Rho termination factor, N-terminal domain
MSEEKGNQTPNTPDVSETELRGMRVDELRQEARDENISGASKLRKEELVKEVAKAKSGNGTSDGNGTDAGSAGRDLGAGPEGGKLRHGDDARLRHVSWEEWFSTFDERGLNFIYQEQRSDGQQSNFFRLENPDREDG